MESTVDGTNGDDVVFECLVCDREFKNGDVLVQHMLSIHTRKRSTTKRSIMTSLEPKELPLKKPKYTPKGNCIGKVFSSNQDSVHSTISSQTGKTFIYILCDERTHNRTSSAKMIKNSKSNTRLVSKRDSVVGNMRKNRHILDRMKISHHVCILCGKSFSIYDELRKHALNVHSIENCCGICGGQFSCNEVLLDHIDGKCRGIPNTEEGKVHSEEVVAFGSELDPNCGEGKGESTNSVIVDMTKSTNFPDRDFDQNYDAAQFSVSSTSLQDNCDNESHEGNVRETKCESGAQNMKLPCAEDCEYNSDLESWVHLNGQKVTCKSQLKSVETNGGVNTSSMAWFEWVHLSGNENGNREKSDRHSKKKKTRSVVKHVCKCGVIHTSNSSLRRHIEEMHLQIRNHRCDCGEEFYSKTQMDVHKKFADHWQNGVEKSNVVEREENGITESESSQSSSVMCHICGEILPGLKALTRHELMHQMQDVPHKCPLCDLTFQIPTRLKRHLKTHVNNSGVYCEICSKDFGSLHELREHNRFVHFDVGNPRFSCTVCCRQCSSHQTLYAHSIRHKTTKDFVCDVCRRAFHLRSQLNRHYNDVHLNMRSFACFLCNRKFNRKQHLEYHMISHAGQKSVSCSMCDSTFKVKDHLDKHMERMHGVFRRRVVRTRLADCAASGEESFSTEVDSINLSTRKAAYLKGLDSEPEPTRNARLNEELLCIKGLVYQCGDCQEGFMELDKLKIHCVKEHGEIISSDLCVKFDVVHTQNGESCTS